jgi:hypothetical protein
MSLLQEMEQYGLADCEFNNKMLHFDNIVFPAAIDFIDLKAKSGVNPSAVITAIFDSYENGNKHYELGRQYTKSGNPEIFTWENLKCL